MGKAPYFVVGHEPHKSTTYDWGSWRVAILCLQQGEMASLRLANDE
jgi:hypothetical protein